MNRFILVLIFLLCYFLLVRAAAPTLVAGDSGELTVAAYSLGVPHPPGYPVFAIMGKLSTLLPCAGPAFRVTCLCAAAVAGCAAVFYCLIQAAGVGWFIAMLTALAAFSAPACFVQGTSAEVYALAALFTVVLLWACLRSPRGGIRAGLAAWFVFGIGLTCHYWFVLLGPLLLVFTWKQVSRSWRNSWLALLLVLIGFSPVFILPLRSFRVPDANWGKPVSARAFWNVLARAQYGTSWSQTRSWKRTVCQVGHLLNESCRGGRIILPFLFVLGMVSRRVDHSVKRLFLGGALLSGMGTVVVVNYALSEPAIEAVRPFFVPFHFLLHGGAGIGLSVVLRWLVKRQWPALAAVIRAAAGAGVLVWLVLALAHGSRRQDETAYQFARNLFRSADVKTTVFITDHDDNYFPLWGVSRLERRWCSVPVRVICARMLCLRWYIEEIIRLYPGLEFPLFPEEVRSVERNRRLRLKQMLTGGGHNFYLITSSKPDLPEGLALRPAGLGYLVVSRSAGDFAPPAEQLVWSTYKDFSSAIPGRPPPLPERRILSYYGLGLMNTAHQLKKAGRYEESRAFMARAERYLPYFEEALLFPYYVRYGNLLVQAQQPDEAAKYFKRALKLKPDRQDIKKVIVNLER
ncbi:MAG: DUF2723 domain-containing protein [Gemmatimonadota bacterium]|nr:DUF2723 domain-containing protein [Gemmatimonadota bacterium]